MQRYAEDNVDRKEVVQYLKAVGSNPLHVGLRIKLLVHTVVLYCSSTTSKEKHPKGIYIYNGHPKDIYKGQPMVTVSELVNVTERRDHKHG